MTIYSTYEYNIRTIVICISAQIAKFRLQSNEQYIYYIFYSVSPAHKRVGEPEYSTIVPHKKWAKRKSHNNTFKFYD